MNILNIWMHLLLRLMRISKIIAMIMIVNTIAGKLSVAMNDCWLRNHTIYGNVFEEHIIFGPLKKIIQKSNVILDIGANNGSHTISYASLNPNATIHSFEPQQELVKHLTYNTTLLNKYNNVSIHNVCVGDEIKECELEPLSVVDRGINGTSLGEVGIGIGGEKCKMITIDSLQLDGCDYMKIDVEGYECLVIQGAKQTIQKFKPIIMFEYNQSFNKYSTTTVFHMLTKMGYKHFEYLDWDNYLAWSDDKSPDLPLDACLFTRFS